MTQLFIYTYLKPSLDVKMNPGQNYPINVPHLKLNFSIKLEPDSTNSTSIFKSYKIVITDLPKDFIKSSTTIHSYDDIVVKSTKNEITVTVSYTNKEKKAKEEKEIIKLTDADTKESSQIHQANQGTPNHEEQSDENKPLLGNEEHRCCTII